MNVDTEDLLTSDEVADLLGLARRQAISTYRSRYDTFPTPAFEKGRCVLWRRQDVEAWARATGRLDD